MRLPDVGRWTIDVTGTRPLLALELQACDLAKNLQTNRAASPFFLVCFAWWYGLITKTDPQLTLVVTGEPPSDRLALRHYRRAWIALEALEQALGDRLTVVGAPASRWPTEPVLNAPLEARSTKASPTQGREHRVEVDLAASSARAAEFSAAFSPITGFHRQLPLGLFNGTVSRVTHWTPGNAAQADLWATSPDEETFHVFELKVAGNESVGALPELLAYSWLLHRARVGLDDGTVVTGGGPGVEAARRASRIVGWLVAPQVHPLLLHEDRSFLEWLTPRLSPALDLRLAFYDEWAAEGFRSWRADESMVRVGS